MQIKSEYSNVCLFFILEGLVFQFDSDQHEETSFKHLSAVPRKDLPPTGRARIFLKLVS